MRRGRGQIAPRVGDLVEHLDDEPPEVVLSSSQLNVLAVSVFLSLNLGMPTLPLRSAILDDPLQSLDDLNMLGTIDLLRRLRDSRQLMVATHDARFAGLLERKLRPVQAEHRTVVIELEGWSREGPIVTQRDVPRDSSPLRIVGVA